MPHMASFDFNTLENVVYPDMKWTHISLWLWEYGSVLKNQIILMQTNLSEGISRISLSLNVSTNIVPVDQIALPSCPDYAAGSGYMENASSESWQ